MSTQELTHMQREVRILRELTIAATETLNKLIQKHSEQLENLNAQLERLEKELADE